MTDWYKCFDHHVASFKKKWPKGNTHEILLHHDGARPHVSHTVVEFLNSQSIETVPHPPYSPYLGHCDFWLFPEAKSPLKGRKLKTRMIALEAHCDEFAEDGLNKWQQRWRKCIETEEGYFEKEHIDSED